MENTYLPPFPPPSYSLKALVCVSCYQRSICNKFQGYCLLLTFGTEHQSLLNPRTPFVRMFFVAACIHIAYKGHVPLWQVVARRWVLDYPTVTTGKDICLFFFTGHGD